MLEVKYFLVLFIGLILLQLQAQEVPEIIQYETIDYNGDHQNWKITQGCRGKLFVANSSGVLQFNGMKWKKISVFDNRKVRSVFTGKDCRIYVGGYETFGYIDDIESNNPNYVDITDSLLIDSAQEIWNIFGNDQYIVFQSFSNIYLYDYQKVQLIIPPSNIMLGNSIGDKFFIPRISHGLYSMQGVKLDLINATLSLPSGSKIAAICQGNKKGQILLATQYNGIFRLEGNHLKPLNMPLNNQLKVEQINRMIKLNSGDYAIGTILNGVYITDSLNNVKYHINKGNGMTNNTVLSLFEDGEGDLWVGLDRGINLIKLSKPISYYYDIEGQFGTFFCYKYYDGKLYIGTNQGVFKKEGDDNFSLIGGLLGQVWVFHDTGSELLCGHNNGLYEIEGQEITEITTNTGVWWIDQISDSLLIAASYTGLILLDKKNNKWKVQQRIQDGEVLLEKFVRDRNTIIGYNPHNKIYILQLSDDFSRVNNIQEYSNLENEPITSSLVFFKSDESLFIEMDTHLYQYNNDIISSITDKVLRLNIEDKLSENELFHAYHLTRKIGHRMPRNIDSNIDDMNYLISFDKGYAVVPKGYTYQNFHMDSVYIDLITVNDELINWETSVPTELSFFENDVSVQFGNKKFNVHDEGSLKYKLEGWTDQWYDIPRDGALNFINLNDGMYHLILKRSSDDVKYNMWQFIIKPQWYKSWKGYLLFFIIGVLVLWIINHWHGRNLEKERESLLEDKRNELEREKMKSRNERLERELLHKSKLLANGAMTLAQKNYMLNDLKYLIKKIDNNDHHPEKLRQKLLHLIDMNINSDDEWEIFERNFAEVHEDFLTNLKEAYPKITSGELRLAAYIRMNLSSKEIAPLLNISIRSVENKRYRLRKRMNLSHTENLSDHIMRF